MNFVEEPVTIMAAGNLNKPILEYFGALSGNTDISICWMISPEGWSEAGQTPIFDEYTIVISGSLLVETKDQSIVVKAGQAIMCTKRSWVRYSTPFDGGAQYIAICLPAFTPEAVNRDAT